MTATRVVLALLVLGLVGAPLGAWFGGSGYLLSVATRGGVMAIAAVSLQFMLGFGGLVSFGHAALVGIGAYAVLVADGGDALFVLPCAMVAAGVFAGVTGVVSLRTEGVTYIMITLAFGQMAYFIAQAWAPLGGNDGMPLYGRSPLGGTGVLDGRYGFHVAVMLCLVGWGLVLRMLALSRFGRGVAGFGGECGAGGGAGV